MVSSYISRNRLKVDPLKTVGSAVFESSRRERRIELLSGVDRCVICIVHIRKCATITDKAAYQLLDDVLCVQVRVIDSESWSPGHLHCTNKPPFAPFQKKFLHRARPPPISWPNCIFEKKKNWLAHDRLFLPTKRGSEGE